MEVRGLSDLPAEPRALLERNLRRCRDEIAKAAQRAGRRAEAVDLLVVTKYVDAEVIRLLHEIGVRDFGENRVQEALEKIETLGVLPDARFHWIGHLQRNKVRRVVKHFRTVHSLDSVRLLRELEARCGGADLPPPPEIYVEVNIAEEPQKTGIAPDQLPVLLEAISESKLFASRIRGLMAMAPYASHSEASRPHFRKLRELRDHHVEGGLLPAAAGLSMGMSADYTVAVEEGATVVRVGSMLYEA